MLICIYTRLGNIPLIQNSTLVHSKKMFQKENQDKKNPEDLSLTYYVDLRVFVANARYPAPRKSSSYTLNLTTFRHYDHYDSSSCTVDLLVIKPTGECFATDGMSGLALCSRFYSPSEGGEMPRIVARSSLTFSGPKGELYKGKTVTCESRFRRTPTI